MKNLTNKNIIQLDIGWNVIVFYVISLTFHQFMFFLPEFRVCSYVVNT